MSDFSQKNRKISQLYWNFTNIDYSFPCEAWTGLGLSVLDLWIGKIRSDRSVLGIYHFMDGNYSFEVKPDIFVPITQETPQPEIFMPSDVIGLNIINLAKRMRRLSIFGFSFDSLNNYPEILKLRKVISLVRENELSGL